MKNLFRLNKYIFKYKWHVLLGIFFVTGSNYFRVLVPRTLRDALDHVQGLIKDKNNVDRELLSSELLEFAILVLGLALLMGIFMYFMRQTIIVMSRLVEYDLRRDIFKKYEKLDVTFFKSNSTGDIMSRISEDVSKVRMYLGPAVLYGINLTSLTILVVYSMLSVSVKLTLYTLLPLPFLSVSIYYVSRIINKKSGRIQTQLAKLTSISQEVYSGIRIVKSYTKENAFNKYFNEESDKYKGRALELAKVNALFFPLMVFLVGMSTLIMIYVGGMEVAAGKISFGNIVEFVIYVGYLTWPFTAVGWLASIIQEAEASQQRINEFLDRKSLIENNSQELLPIKGALSFKDVQFTYPETGVHAIKNVSFDLPAGGKMAIIGKTASGKSTIAELLLRMYDVDEGKITIDGLDIKDHNIGELRKYIGYVPQDVFLFSDTVENNIRFGEPDASSDTIKEYARYAAVHEDIEKLPEGYQTLVGERGVTLSGGQKQRISLARAFIKNPSVVILDDCLSAVDTNTEKRILDYIQKATSDRTAIIITHRIYSLLDFDKIIVLDEGVIVEQGNHEELLAMNGIYTELYEQQQLEMA